MRPVSRDVKRNTMTKETAKCQSCGDVIEGEIYHLGVKCQDIDDPSLTVKNVRTSMTRFFLFCINTELIIKRIEEFITKINL